MQGNRRGQTLWRTVKYIAMILTVFVCIAGIFVLSCLSEDEKKAFIHFEEKEQQQMLELRPLYKEKANLEKHIKNIETLRTPTGRIPAIIIIVTDCTSSLMDDIAPILSQYGFPAVLCINDQQYPGQEGCITVNAAQGLINKGWEFVVEAGSNINNLTSLMTKFGLSSPVAIFDPMINKYDDTVNTDLPVIHYGAQKDCTYYDAVYGFNTEELLYATDSALYNKTTVILTVGSYLDREKFDVASASYFLNLIVEEQAVIDIDIITLSENYQAMNHLIEQQHETQIQTEAEYQNALAELEEINKRIEAVIQQW